MATSAENDNPTAGDSAGIGVQEGIQEGVRFGNYEIVRPVGKGKFAIVYRARALAATSAIEAGETVALKRINVNSIDDKSRDKCLKEVKLLQNLDHPNIIKYLDSFITDNDLVIVVEWAAAGDLKRQLRKAQEKGVGFEERIIWKYFSQICDAIQHMHERRTMHRDLKPANIFLTLDGKVKVGDLGLSRELSEHTMQAHSKVGTPLYMSPEVLRGDGYDFKSDIWSLGCMLYELAMLKSPFKAEGLNLYSLFQKISQGDYQPLPENYSEELRSLTYGMISTRSEDRPDIDSICHTARKMRNLTQDRYIQSKKGGGSSAQASISESKAENSADMSTSSGNNNLKANPPDLADPVDNDDNDDKEYVPVPRSRAGSTESGGPSNCVKNTSASVKQAEAKQSSNVDRSSFASDDQVKSSGNSIYEPLNSNKNNANERSSIANSKVPSNSDNSSNNSKSNSNNNSNNSNNNSNRSSNNNSNYARDNNGDNGPSSSGAAAHMNSDISDLFNYQSDSKSESRDRKAKPTIPQASYRAKADNTNQVTTTRSSSSGRTRASSADTGDGDGFRNDSRDPRIQEQRSEADLEKMANSSFAIPLMESIYNKLALLGFSFYDRKKMNYSLLPFHFAIDMKLVAGSGAKFVGNQFRKLVEVTQWICAKSKIAKAVEVVDRIDFDRDAPIMIARILLSLFDIFKISVPTGEEIPQPTNLIQGHGDTVCRYLLYMVDKLLEIIGLLVGPLKYAAEESSESTGAEDLENDEEIEEDDLFEGNTNGGGYVLNSDDDRADGIDDAFHASSSNLLAGSMIIPTIDPSAWKEETERVSSKLTKLSMPTGGDWQGHLNSIVTHFSILRGGDWKMQEKSSCGEAILREVTDQIKQIASYTINDLEAISRVEIFINKISAVYSMSGQYQSYKTVYDEYSKQIIDANSKISEYTSKLDEIATQIEDFGAQLSTLAGNDGNQTSPLIKVKEAIVRIKHEIHDLNLRTGILSSSLVHFRHEQNKDVIKRRLNKSTRARAKGGKYPVAASNDYDDEIDS